MRKLVSGLLLAIAISTPTFGRGFGGFKTSKPVQPNQYSMSRLPPLPLPPKPTPIPDYSKETFKPDYDEACAIEYVPPVDDAWQTPKKTREIKKGDCKAKAFLLYESLKKKKLESKVVFGYMNNDYKNGHAWVELNFHGTTLILDPLYKNKEIHKKSEYTRIPRYDYNEYPESEGYKKQIEEFILKIEKQ